MKFDAKTISAVVGGGILLAAGAFLLTKKEGKVIEAEPVSELDSTEEVEDVAEAADEVEE